MATETASKSRVQPKWFNPATKATNPPVLKLYNSLTKSKTEFIPTQGKRVTWYNCGPTVYDASHMGHARTYLSMDIIRRVLQDYFHYDVLFVQNITDIDDKIILRARHEYLFKQFKNATSTLSPELIQRVEASWNQYATSKLAAVAGAVEKATSDWEAFVKAMTPEELAKAVLIDEKFKMHVSALQTSHNAILLAKDSLTKGDSSKAAADALLDSSKDIISLSLDKEKGADVNDPKIFRELPAYWEDMFFKDMAALNVLPPDIQTRVSEYIPEIIAYVEKIIANGYAYVGEGSVYFDTASYDGHNGHHYAKLEPTSKGNADLIEDGEGSLGAKLMGRRSMTDFALWKKSKPGEPEWDSPWGKGRPGWHIECSVMASAVLGGNMDIHSGGVDLAFPHHDNELAQSEAYYDCNQWVNYFLHAGHLHVEGQKMSKSLKNFITIQEALQTYTARQLRIFFLLHQWNTKMDFKQSGMQEAIQVETTMKNFFDNVKALAHKIRADGSRGADEHADGTITHRFRDAEKNLIKTFQEKQDSVHAALCDSINTPEAMGEMMGLITQTNKYIAENSVNIHLVESVARWITNMLKTFGVTSNGSVIGFGSSEQSEGSSEDTLMPYLHALSSFRDRVRQLALKREPHVEFLRLSDELRDVQLVDLGVALDDQKDGTALVKLASREELIKAREEKLAREAAKEAQIAQARAERERKERELLEKSKIAPEDMFKNTGEYSQFDETGVPTHTKDGEELTKSRRKKLQKEWAAQKKLHDKYLQQKGGQ